MKRTYTTRLQDEIILALKIESAKKGIPASDIIEEALKRYLKVKKEIIK